MPITHAMEASFGEAKVRILQHADGAITITPASGSEMTLSKGEAELLARILPHFLQNLDQFEIKD